MKGEFSIPYLTELYVNREGHYFIPQHKKEEVKMRKVWKEVTPDMLHEGLIVQIGGGSCKYRVLNYVELADAQDTTVYIQRTNIGRSDHTCYQYNVSALLTEVDIFEPFIDYDPQVGDKIVTQDLIVTIREINNEGTAPYILFEKGLSNSLYIDKLFSHLQASKMYVIIRNSKILFMKEEE